MGELSYKEHTIAFDEYGGGERTIVLVHGLLMNSRMFERLGPALAERGNRVICVDLLGHGRSDQPEDLRLYSMPLFAEQVVALLDHLGLETGGGRRHLAGRQRRRSSWRLATPIGPRACSSRCRSSTTRWPRSRRSSPRCCSACGSAGRSSRSPRGSPRSSRAPTSWSTSGSTGLRRRPGPSVAVLEGLLLGETAPGREQRRRIARPTLVVGHPRDPLHPFSDSGMLAEELQQARLVEADSILEWRIAPQRLTDELALFLDEVWAPTDAPGCGGYRLQRRWAGGRPARRLGQRWRTAGRKSGNDSARRGRNANPRRRGRANGDWSLSTRSPAVVGLALVGGIVAVVASSGGGGGGEAHINQASGSTNGVTPDERAAPRRPRSKWRT